MKIVINTNIFASAFHRGGNPLIILERVARELDALYMTDEIFNEIMYVIRKPKFHHSPQRIDIITRFIELIMHKITVSAEFYVDDSGCRDKKDIMYLECALVSGADYIISGDIHLRELKEHRGIKIVSPKEYLDIVDM